MPSVKDGVQLAAELIFAGQSSPAQQLLALGFSQGQIPGILAEAQVLVQMWAGRK